MSDYRRTCRLCKKLGWREEMIKYGTRDYAHFGCFAERKSDIDIARLAEYPRQKFEEWRAREAAERTRKL